MPEFKDYEARDENGDVTGTVRARQVEVSEGEDVNTPAGVVHVSKGDYVIERPESVRGVYDTLPRQTWESLDWAEPGAPVEDETADAGGNTPHAQTGEDNNDGSQTGIGAI